jgi:hypothetical protein
MRILLTTLAMSAYSVFGSWTSVETIMAYRIIENVFDSSIAEGSTFVTGTVTVNKKPLFQGLIGNVTNSMTTTTDSLGQFNITLSETDSILYFFKPSYAEIITSKLEFKSQHRMTIEFYASDRLIYTISAKPVIYLYSDEKEFVDLKLEVHGETTFTYPVLEDSWKVFTSPSGTLTDLSGNTYPYLFWEGEHAGIEYTLDNGIIKNSYQIKTDTLIEFLESKLSEFGLNATEQTDFITYWGPRLVKDKFVLLQFLFDADYTAEIANIQMKPAPSSTLRVYMKYSGLSAFKQTLRTQPVKSKSFNRIGLTLVEWGGTNLELPKIEF